ncbi:hypothetical protein JW823_01570 [bacterium]|nr:hypothetical protein [candidate division CSSED10-310 bacterium]
MAADGNRDLMWFERVFGRTGRQFVFSAVLWIGFLFSSKDSTAFFKYLMSWILLSALTGIADHIGIITRLECRDLRFMWLSIYGKLPRWVLWVFWLLVLAVLYRPVFGIPALAASGLAFYRRIHFIRQCMGYRIVLLTDLFFRFLAGLLPVVL